MNIIHTSELKKGSFASVKMKSVEYGITNIT